MLVHFLLSRAALPCWLPGRSLGTSHQGAGYANTSAPQPCLPACAAPAVTATHDATTNPLTKTTFLPQKAAPRQKLSVLRLTPLTTQTEHRQL